MDQFDDRSPIYQQIADGIRDSILSGELAEEGQVMSTTQYAATYRINPATAAKAMSLLVDEGLLYKQRGLGMFVAPGARASLTAHRRAAYYDDVLAPALDQAAVLGIGRDEIIRHIMGEKK